DCREELADPHARVLGAVVLARVAGAEREDVGDLAAARVDHADAVAPVQPDRMPFAGGHGDGGGVGQRLGRAGRTRNSPSWLAFRPPAERAFELPLQLLRPASNYSGGLDGAAVTLRHRATGCNPKVHAVCDVPERPCEWLCPAPRGTGHLLLPPAAPPPRTTQFQP